MIVKGTVSKNILLEGLNQSKDHQPSGSGEKDFSRVFTIYWHGGHLGHMNNLLFPHLRSLMIFEFNWPSGFRGKDVWKCWRMNAFYGFPYSSTISNLIDWQKYWHITLKKPKGFARNSAIWHGLFHLLRLPRVIETEIVGTTEAYHTTWKDHQEIWVTN